jgi:very-short-patch-repair endonuclease
MEVTAMPHDLVSRRRRGNARAMRSEMTPAELKLWNALRGNRLMGLKFRRQVPIGPYIVDFACPSKRLIVEADGSQHSDNVAYDENRTTYLKQTGWTVLRFFNHDVLNDIDGTCQHIVNLAGLTEPEHAMPVPFSSPQEHAS